MPFPNIDQQQNAWTSKGAKRSDFEAQKELQSLDVRSVLSQHFQLSRARLEKASAPRSVTVDYPKENLTQVGDPTAQVQQRGLCTNVRFRGRSYELQRSR
jgi:hypothetical protein